MASDSERERQAYIALETLMRLGALATEKPPMIAMLKCHCDEQDPYGRQARCCSYPCKHNQGRLSS